MEEKMKHLEFVQNVITRMNTNSFQLKGWAITIVSALLALFASSDNEVLYIFVAIVPTLIFWFLDAYYLQQERKFIGLYNDITDGKEKSFNMNIDKYVYDKNNKDTKRYCYWDAFFSVTIWPLYLVIAIGLIVGGIVLI